MFNKDFYPTPKVIIDRMISGLDLLDKNVLEPSAGKGDIVDALNELGAKVSVCELNKDLAKISYSKANFICDDFLKLQSKDVSHFDFIIMNPPFSNGEKHINHAWEIAPEGCQIVTLCNSETVLNTFTRGRSILSRIIKENGTHEELGDCFSDAERKTGVEVSLINLFKPKTGKDEFEGYFDLEDDEELQENAIIKHNEVRELVNRYKGAVLKFDTVMRFNNEMNDLISPISRGLSIKFGCTTTSGGYSSEINRENFKKKLQKSAWETVFSKFNMEKYVTKSLKEDLNKFVEKQSNVPFTMSNVYKMINMVVGTHGARMQKVCEEVFDQLTKYTHENRFQLEGWKTNSEYMVNKKFIVNKWGGVTTDWYGGMTCEWRESFPLDDLTKALCHISGIDYNKLNAKWYEFLNACGNKDFEQKKFGVWYDFGFLEVKGFKKGTIHCKFKDESLWLEFNRIACKEKGFQLASKYQSDFRKKNNSVTKF